MCGLIAGYADILNIRDKIMFGMEKIKHRGFDDFGFKHLTHKNAFLAHTRLSIVGIDNGKQPLTSFDGKIHAIVNGEFYDEQLIKQNLLDGVTFKTNSDSEILIHLYQKFGVSCLQFLHGEFAFVLYDETNDLWFCARDRFGIRPLQYFFDQKTFLIASEAKALAPLMNLSLDKESLYFSQHFQYLPQSKTLFNKVEMIQPAHYILIQNNKIETQCYWEFPEKTTTDSYQQACEYIEYLIKQSVKKRIPKEVDYCTHLSGGIDSSIIAYELNQEKSTEAFTIAFTDDDFYNESSLAKIVSNQLNNKINVIETTFKDCLFSMANAIYHAEGLSINGHIGAKYLLNKAIHERGFKVAFSGEGSDEIYMGYSHLKQDFLNKEALSDMEKSYLKGIQLPEGDGLDLNELQQCMGFVPTWIKAKSSMALKLKDYWTESFVQTRMNPNHYFIQESQCQNLVQRYGTNKTSSLLWIKYCLNNYILKVLDDAQSMAWTVEGRLPFLDTQLVEYAWSLPNDFYYKKNVEKSILRDIYKDKLPKEIINKNKQSFMSPPLSRALSNKYTRDFIYYYLTDNDYFLKQDIYKQESIKKGLLRWEKDDKVFNEPILMTMLSLSILCEQFRL